VKVAKKKGGQASVVADLEATVAELRQQVARLETRARAANEERVAQYQVAHKLQLRLDALEWALVLAQHVVRERERAIAKYQGAESLALAG
jgi:hypothetical protein